MKRRLLVSLSAFLLAIGVCLSSLAPARAVEPVADASTYPGAGVIKGRGKEIFVSLRKQRLWAYHNGEVVYTFLISSGEPKRGTRTGNFRVQSKIPEAWSRVWQLRMPYWMGIYNVGRIENGIHAMPMLKSGRLVRWAVGHPASFGCVVANTADATKLYRWASLGTPVYIRW